MDSTPLIIVNPVSGPSATRFLESDQLKLALRRFPRQALHAARLSLTHPISGEPLEVTSELPQDMQELLASLERDSERE